MNVIKYYLLPNSLGRKPHEHVARVLFGQTLHLEGLIREMLQQGSTLTEPDLQATFTLLTSVLSIKVAQGCAIILPFVQVRPGIKGVFTSAADSFDKNRHKKTINCTAGSALLRAVRHSGTVKQEQPLPPAPIVWELLDRRSQVKNARLSPGGIGEIIGEQLKFNSNNVSEGLYLLHSDKKTSVKITELALSTAKKLIFVIPADLPAGSYTLEVRRAYGKKGQLRSGQLSKEVIVSE